MFAKIFTQILDSSLADDYLTRLVFEDMLKLCDLNGVVDMTPEALSRRTNVPLEIVTRGIQNLEGADMRSRSPEHGGRRIVRLDEHREWGWLIVNYQHYRGLASEEQRREKTRLRVEKYREKASGNGLVTHGNECNAMEREKEMEKKKEEGGVKSQPEIFMEEWNRLPDPFPKIRMMSSGRRSALATRFRDEGWRENWLAALQKLPLSPFLRGKNDRGWIADVEFFLRPDSVAKILEGKYADAAANPPVTGKKVEDHTADLARFKAWAAMPENYPKAVFRTWEDIPPHVREEFLKGEGK